MFFIIAGLLGRDEAINQLKDHLIISTIIIIALVTTIFILYTFISCSRKYVHFVILLITVEFIVKIALVSNFYSVNIFKIILQDVSEESSSFTYINRSSSDDSLKELAKCLEQSVSRIIKYIRRSKWSLDRLEILFITSTGIF